MGRQDTCGAHTYFQVFLWHKYNCSEHDRMTPFIRSATWQVLLTQLSGSLNPLLRVAKDHRSEYFIVHCLDTLSSQSPIVGHFCSQFPPAINEMSGNYFQGHIFVHSHCSHLETNPEQAPASIQALGTRYACGSPAGSGLLWRALT